MSEGWVTASAPGKLVILGEHAVVYGKPAVVIATDRRFRCSVRRNDVALMNGEPFDPSKQPHIDHIIRDTPRNFEFRTYSDIPPGAGMGSSAALSASSSLAIRSLMGRTHTEEELVDDAWGTEVAVQGSASPMDASACVHGKGIAINIPGSRANLWTKVLGDRKWEVSDLKVPKMTFVIGNTGIRAPTGPLVAKVRRFFDSNGFASEIIDEISAVTLEGADALAEGDKERLGRMMTQDHRLLSILGVSCNELNKLVNASLPYSYGAKLTGSGGGGCMVALTDEPKKVCEVISSRGGTPYVVNAGSPGAMLE